MKKSLRKIVVDSIPIVSIGIVMLLSIYFCKIIWEYPLVGIEVKESSGQYTISSIYPRGWADGKVIEKGDIVEYINGKDPKLHGTVAHFSRIEMAESVTIKKDHAASKTFSISYDDLHYQYGFFLLSPSIFIIFAISLSVYLYRKKKEDNAAPILVYFLLSLGICYLSAFCSARGNILGWIITHITLSGSMILFVHFLTNYFLKLGLTFIKKNTLKILYIIFSITVILFCVLLFLWDTSIVSIVELALFVVILCFTLFTFTRFYFKNKHTEEKNSLKILFFTLVIAFTPFVCFYAIPHIFLKNEWMSGEGSATFLIVIPIAFVYLQLAERLFDIHFLISRFRYYFLLALPFAIFITIILAVNNDIHIQPSYNITTFLLIFISTMLFLYAKEFIDYKNRSHLFSQKNNYATSLYLFFQKNKNKTNVNSLILQLMNEIKGVLIVNEVYSIEIQKEENDKIWTLKNKNQYSINNIKVLEKINWENVHLGSLVELKNGFCIVISEEINTKGIIFCGLKKSKINLNLHEKIWLESMAYFSGIMLENVKQIEALFRKIEDYKEKNKSAHLGYPHWLSRLLFSLSEKERTNLSNDLHDSVLQDQLQLLREVDRIKGKIDDRVIISDLINLKERILDNIHLIRETCNELRPPFLGELGIIQSILNLIEQTKLRSDFILHSELDHTIHKLNQDDELTLYRVVQELLNNAMKHSTASEVWLSLKNINQSVILSYQDNGRGMDMTKLQDSFKTMGITGIKERVRCLGGEVWIDSKPGNGLQVRVELKTGVNIYD